MEIFLAIRRRKTEANVKAKPKAYHQQCWQTLKQGHDDALVSHGYLLENELFHEHLHLVDVVQHVIILLYLAREKLPAYKNNIRQILYLVNVTKKISRLHWSFATVDVSMLLIR